MKEQKAAVRVLLAEDNPADVYLIRRALGETASNILLDVVPDGEVALNFLSGQNGFDEAVTPSLILLDLNLPKYDGTEVLKQVRQDSRLAPIPVIVLTSSDSPKDQQMIAELGATRYIRKPSSLNEFMAIGAVVQEVLASEALSAGAGSGHPL